MPQCDQLGVFSSYVHDVLFNSSCSRILDSNLHLDWVDHYFAHQLLNSWLHRCAKHELGHFGLVGKIGQDLVYLLKEAHLKHFVCLVNHNHFQTANCGKQLADASKLQGRSYQDFLAC